MRFRSQVLSLFMGMAAVFIEIVSDALGVLPCFAIVGVSGMVCFLSLAYLFAYCRREEFSRPGVRQST